ncbi:PREDICTED: uncharacterized protein LOC107162970 [Diuraphis noxia]|uniref:uncharacterized protein LOC107162970 n=1 Tax=Diuraphis noxia TaxID=143948 RepID=UPI00076392EB|nr:PREDICTED: uncharacterized protein LOC107162970 [Diuraphis noxia]
MEYYKNFDDYNAKFEPFIVKPNNETYKTMKLFFKTTSIEFIIKNWDLQKCINIEDSNYNSLMFKNGSSVVLAKVEIYDWRHIFVRSIDYFVNVCKQLQMHCENASNVLRILIPGEIVAVKCTDKFYRGKIIDILENLCFSLYLIDDGYVVSASIDCIVDLPDALKKIPPTVCLVGLKDITLKPWSPEAYLYVKQLFENATTMVLEFSPVQPLKDVSLTTVNGNENVNKRLNELLNNDDSSSTADSKYQLEQVCLTVIPAIVLVKLKNVSSSVLNEAARQYITSISDNILIIDTIEDNTNEVIFKTEDNENVNDRLKELMFENIKEININDLIEIDEEFKSDQSLVECNVTTLKPGSVVYLTAFVNMDEMYIRKIEDYNDEFQNLLDKVNEFCLSAKPINRPLIIGQIVGAQSTLDGSFYRGKVLKKIDDITYSIQFIDFGDKDNVSSSKIFEIPTDFMVPSTIMEISLKGIKSHLLSIEASNYITNLLSTYEPLSIDFDDKFPIKDVTLVVIKNNENVAENLNKLLKDENHTIPNKVLEDEHFKESPIKNDPKDSITEENKVVLISASTQCNLNKDIKKLLCNGNVGQNIQNGVYTNCDEDSEKCVIKYYKPPLDVVTQVWVAEKISSSKYSVHTCDSRLEFLKLENKIFEDSKTFECVKSVSVNMPCIVYFSPSWYRGEVLEVIDKVTAKVGLVDVGNFSVVRSVKEIFRMPSKYKGKSLLVNIEIQPEPQEKLSVTTFRIVAKKHLDNVTVVEVLHGSTVDQSYDDLDNVGLPSFSSTPIPEDSGRFQFNNSRNEQNLLSTTLCQEQQTSGADEHNSKRFSNMLTIKDVPYAKWLKGAVKTLTFLCVNGDCLMMRDHLIDDTLADLEAKIQEHCVTTTNPLYTPAENELCLAKYIDQLWYRAICVKVPNDLDEDDNGYMVYFLDWGMEYLTNVEDLNKMPKDFIYLPATAHKCYVKGALYIKIS